MRPEPRGRGMGFEDGTDFYYRIGMRMFHFGSVGQNKMLKGRPPLR